MSNSTKTMATGIGVAAGNITKAAVSTVVHIGFGLTKTLWFAAVESGSKAIREGKESITEAINDYKEKHND